MNLIEDIEKRFESEKDFLEHNDITVNIAMDSDAQFQRSLTLSGKEFEIAKHYLASYESLRYNTTLWLKEDLPLTERAIKDILYSAQPSNDFTNAVEKLINFLKEDPNNCRVRFYVLLRGNPLDYFIERRTMYEYLSDHNVNKDLFFRIIDIFLDYFIGIYIDY